MKWTVVWGRTAERALTEIWLSASDRDAVTRAAMKIDSLLRASPNDSGESRGSGERILFAAPLGALYSVEPQDYVVHVQRVWTIRRRLR